jgi:hypothetical protein
MNHLFHIIKSVVLRLNNPLNSAYYQSMLYVSASELHSLCSQSYKYVFVYQPVWIRRYIGNSD